MKIRVIALCVFLVATTTLYLAQSSTATLIGSAVDESGAVVPAVQVNILNPSTGFLRKVVTNAEGYFTIPSLPPGTYIVQATHKDFNQKEIRDVVLHVGDQVTLQIKLKVRGASQSVTVTENASLIQDSAVVSTAIDPNLVKGLPLNGRTFQALLALVPGVVPTPDPRMLDVNGQRGVSNATSIDGVSANIQGSIVPFDFVYQMGSLPGLTATGTTQSLATVDELQEFTVQTTGYTAQYGRQSGAQVSFVTKSGTNQFHGSAYEYFRNEALDANDWFLNKTTPPTKRPKLRQNDVGGTLGGPLVKDKTFFFFALEIDPLLQPKVSSTTVPTQAYRSSVAAAVLPLVNMFPLPNGAVAANGLSGIYIINESIPSFTDAATLKLDQNLFSGRLHMFARYHRAPSHLGTPALSYLDTLYTHTDTLTYGATYTVNPRVVSDFHFNFSRNSNGRHILWHSQPGNSPQPASALMPPGQTFEDSEVFVAIREPSFSTGSIFLGQNQKTIQRQWQATENLSMVRGKHRLEMGVDWRTIRPDIQLVAGGYSSISITNGATAAVTDYATVGLVSVSAKTNSTSLYVADTWTVMPRLTLDLGLRWEFQPAPAMTKGPQFFVAQNFDPNNPAVATLASSGSPLWKTRYTNFAPRVGAAYHLFSGAGHDTVLRGSFGLFYDMGLGSPLGFVTGAPFTTYGPTVTGTYPSILTNPALLPTPNLQPPYSSLTLYDPNMKMPYTMSWTLGLQQSLGQNQSLSATYVGNRGERLLMQVSKSYANNPLVTTTGSMVQDSNQAKSWYDALQVQYNRRFAHGLQAIANYTWSHSIDTASDEFTTLPSGVNFDVNLNKASSSFDVRHAFSAGVTYAIPAPFGNRALKAVLGGWSLDPLVRAYSPKPVNVSYSYSVTGQLSYSLYPDRVAGQPLWISDPTQPRGQRLNPAAFTIPVFSSGTQVRQGNAGRNSARGFSATQADLAIRRDFKLTERLGLQFSGEIFNIFNHPIFTNPSGSYGSVLNGSVSVYTTSFGRSGSMLSNAYGATGTGSSRTLPVYAFGGQRDVQFAFKVTF